MEGNTEERIRDVMSAVFAKSVDEINYDSSPDTIDSWDSLKHLSMVVALEEEFEVHFSDEQTIQMLNYKLVVAVVNEALSKSKNTTI